MTDEKPPEEEKLSYQDAWQDPANREPAGGWRVRTMGDYERYIETIHSLCNAWEAGRITCDEFDRLDDHLGKEAEQTTLVEFQSNDPDLIQAACELRDQFVKASQRQSAVLRAVFALQSRLIGGDSAELVHGVTLRATEARQVSPGFLFRPWT